MEKANVYLFSRIGCPHCPPAKDFAIKFQKDSTRQDFNLKILDTGTLEGRSLADKFQIRSVPTFIITGPGYKDNIGLIGIQNEKTMNKYIDLALGKEKTKLEKKVTKKKSKVLKIGKFKIKL